MTVHHGAEWDRGLKGRVQTTMTARAWRRSLVVCALIGLSLVVAHAAELQERTRVAYEDYAAQARQAFLAAANGGGSRQVEEPSRQARLRSGAVVAGPGAEDGIIGVPGGLVHHWVGTIFVPDVALDDVLELSRSYERYPSMYESVISSRVLERTDETFQLLLRLEERASVVTAVLDVWSDVRYVRVNGTRAYSLTNAREIREVKDPGAPGEQHLPAGRDRGFLWRANTFALYTAADGGVYMQLETLGLSRRFPPMLGWIIEPIARRLGRKSVEMWLREFRDSMVPDAGPQARASASTGPAGCFWATSPGAGSNSDHLGQLKRDGQERRKSLRLRLDSKRHGHGLTGWH